MKINNNILLICGVLILINSCRMPSNALGEIKIIKRLDIINTVGNCLDLDVDINDSVLIAAANYAGYYVFDIQSNLGIID
ncbi:uncharacterized protein METZ01_LOCUS416690, partial [marine metagenome]